MKNGVIITPISKPTPTADRNTFEIEGLSLNSTSVADEGYYYCVVIIDGFPNFRSLSVSLFFIGGKV